MVFYFGSHITDDYITSVNDIYNLGGNIIQIFVSSNSDKEELLQLKTKLEKNSMKCVIHSTYLANIAKKWDEYSWWIKALELELEIANEIGAIGVVIHFGKQLNLSLEEAYNNMYSCLIYLLDKTRKYNHIKIFLETTAGQGTELCYKLEDLAYFFKKFTKCVDKNIKDRVKICLDTCHIFAAGYNIKSKSYIKMYLDTFEELIGLKHIQLIHLNDSKCELGCRIDRHENIGEGKIGLVGLRIIFDYFRKLNIPIILETPKNEKNEIKLLLNN